MKLPSPLRGSIVALTYAFFLQSGALAADFEYIKIMNSGDALSGGGTLGTMFDYDLEGTDVVFSSSFSNSPLGTRGISRVANGVFTPVATNTTAIPGGTGTFTNFSNPTISNGQVAFRGFVGSGPFTPTGIFLTNNGNLTRVAGLTTPVPGGSGAFTGVFFGTDQTVSAGGSIAGGTNAGLSNGALAFAGSGAGPNFGIYYASPGGTLTRVADSNTSVRPSGQAGIDNGEIAFVGAAAGGQKSMYRYSVADQALTAVASPGANLPSGVFLKEHVAPAISGGAIAFSIEKTDNGTYDGIYIADANGARLVADGATSVPGGGGTFVTGTEGLGFNGVSLSEGSVAFYSARSAGGSGIYTTLGGELVEVISTDDTLSGRAILDFNIGSPKISGSNILFNARFQGGGTGLYVAMGEHHWDAAGGGVWDIAGNWSFDLAPRGVVPTFLDPAYGGVITGPAGSVTLKSLTIGAAQSGIAQLQMQSGGQINGGSSVTITPRGRVDLAGVLTSTGSVDNSGVIAGSGQIAASLNNRESGQVRVGAGKAITVATSNSSNAGVIEVTGGELEFTGTLTNASSTGFITARDATLRFGTLTNAGSLAIVAGTTDVHGDVINTGNIVVSGGAAGGTQTAIFHGDVEQNGTLTISAAGTTRSIAVFLGNFSGAGGITGGGDVFFEGDLRPGNSPASVTYAANVSLGSTSQLTLELGGLLMGTQYDHLAVTGDFSLGGNLNVVLVNGFSPQPGNTFDLLDFDVARVSGNFASIQLPILSGDATWDTSGFSSSGTLSVVPEPATGLMLCLGTAIFAMRRRSVREIADPVRFASKTASPDPMHVLAEDPSAD